MKEDESIRLEMHPATMFTLEESEYERFVRNGCPLGQRLERLFGIPLSRNVRLRPCGWVEKWFPPKERFITYEEGDEEWCRFCGIGSVREVLDPGEIKICRDLPEYSLPQAANRVLWSTFDGDVCDLVGYDCFEDRDYVHAIEAKRFIEKQITEFMMKKKERASL